MFSTRAMRMAGCLLALAPAVAWAQGASAPAPAAQAEPAPAPQVLAPDYRIGPGDVLQIFVWKNPELSAETPVRPDGKITTPLVQELQAQGRTPAEFTADLRKALSQYIQDPMVSITIKNSAMANNQAAIRVIGAAATPKTVPYRRGLTVLDVMVEVGGLNTFAAGNRARLLRRQQDGQYSKYPLRLAELMKGGNLKANMDLMPGDIIQIPQRGF